MVGGYVLLGAPPPGPTQDYGTDIREWLVRPGDQALIVPNVPNRIYTAGAVTAPHAATAGPYGGNLVLVAEDPGEVTINQAGLNAAKELVLNAGSTRIGFVGFNFTGDLTGGQLRVFGSDIWFWHCDFQRPLDGWTVGKGPLRVVGVNFPTGNNPPIAGQRVSFYGCDFHNAASSLLAIRSAGDNIVQGCKWYDAVEPAADLEPSPDEVHLDWIFVNSTSGVELRDGYVMSSLRGGSEIQPRWSDISDFVVENMWVNNPQRGFAFSVRTRTSDVQTVGVYGTRNNVWSWNHGGGADRVDTDGTTVWTTPAGHNTSPYIEVTDTNIHTTAPTGTDPATVWRAANPVDSWADFFGWA